jgi:DNA polymerase III subunit epsilon
MSTVRVSQDHLKMGGSHDAAELERLALLLEDSGQYRILRRLHPIPAPPTAGGMPKRGIYLDVETTGLDAENDEIVELAMLAFDYSMDGRSCAVGESYEALRDPGRPIPPDVTALTGIDDAMVAGRAIDITEVTAFVSRADLIVAHNAEFDRRFCERLGGVFAGKPWACSFREVAWKNEGFDSARLSHLALGHGLFFVAHRALDDCRAGLEILSRPLPRSGRTALATLLDSARRPRWRIRAVGAPFGARAALKSRGYRWNDGSKGGTRGWCVDIDEDALEAEAEFLRRDIYQRHDVVIDARRFTAMDRYSNRCQ